MSASWEIKASRKVMAYTIHVETTSVDWAVGLRRLIIPGEFVAIPPGMPFDMARNAAVQQFLQSPYEYLFSIDSDVVAPPDTIIRLLNHNLPVVSAMYCRRSPPWSVPVAMKNGQWLSGFVPGQLVEVDLVGNGALLVHRSVFEWGLRNPIRAGKIWYDWRVDLKGTGVVPEDSCLSEDFSWNHHIRTKGGYKIYLDTSIRCSHLGMAKSDLGTFVPISA